jgi:flagellar biosynthesis/type III secretory pathway M-ring protein FliF/YscJ
MEALLVALILIVVVAGVVVFVIEPLRASNAGEAQGEGEDSRIAELEARKQAKYREIRDTELDHAAGKLSDADFPRQDAELRRDAIQILRELDELRED